mmetsp:Transcript_32615/g.79343  ORF Transcript_32615/g.79343 Transcript_32615/m.79343 type:complete len:230 (-) Transcript_32615:591-1280(-)
MASGHDQEDRKGPGPYSVPPGFGVRLRARAEVHRGEQGQLLGGDGRPCRGAVLREERVSFLQRPGRGEEEDPHHEHAPGARSHAVLYAWRLGRRDRRRPPRSDADPRLRRGPVRESQRPRRVPPGRGRARLRLARLPRLRWSGHRVQREHRAEREGRRPRLRRGPEGLVRGRRRRLRHPRHAAVREDQGGRGLDRAGREADLGRLARRRGLRQRGIRRDGLPAGPRDAV